MRLPHPIMLWIEPSAGCNLDCAGCPTAAGRLGGVMRFKQFKHILDQAPWLKMVNLWHRGEPLVSVDFPLMVEEATRRGIKSQTHSNGIMLAHKKRADDLVDARLTRIGIGIDGPDDATYQAIRTGGTIEEVEAGVRALVDAKRRKRSKYPKIVAECLLGNQRPEQFGQVRELALKWGVDEVRFKTYKVPDPNDLQRALELLPADQRLWRYDQNGDKLKMKRKHEGCWRLAFSAVVTWDGKVLPCCFDAITNFNMGNAFEEPLVDIWRGERLREFQSKVSKDRDTFRICRNCTEGLPRLYVQDKLALGQKGKRTPAFAGETGRVS